MKAPHKPDPSRKPTAHEALTAFLAFAKAGSDTGWFSADAQPIFYDMLRAAAEDTAAKREDVLLAFINREMKIDTQRPALRSVNQRTGRLRLDQTDHKHTPFRTRGAGFFLPAWGDPS